MKFNLSILTLSLALSASPTLAMDISDADLHPSDRSMPSLNTQGLPKVANPKLFTKPELTDMEIGWAIIQQRIGLKNRILDFLESEENDYLEKSAMCLADFGITPNSSPILSFESIQVGIQRYCTYLNDLKYIYAIAQNCAQRMLEATTLEDKHLHQNDIFYLLSCETRHFRDFVKEHYTHEIPEHSLEDTFYEMISSRMCATATKPYAIVNDYLVTQFTEQGMKKQIDNKRLQEEYQQKHKALIGRINSQCPIFWLSSVDTGNQKLNAQLKELLHGKTEQIKERLAPCGQDFIDATDTFTQQLRTYTETHVLDKDTDVISMYRICGPWLLETIRAYEAITCRILEIERQGIAWLKEFKGGQLFRKLPKEVKELIAQYLITQDKRESEERRILKKREEEKKAVKPVAAKKLTKKKPQKRDAAPAEQSPVELPKLEQTPNLEQTPKADGELLQLPSSSAVEKKSEIAPIKPLKIKTRPAHPVLQNAVLESNEAETLQELPAEYQTNDFRGFLKLLLEERNERKLKSLFTQLSSLYGIHAEWDEKNNKGYFAVKSPITGEIHVRTYHNLHADNPYASFFMAVRQVLIAADLLER